MLYFAQYIVTYVDEDARQKALKRLEDEIASTETVAAEKVNAQILEIKHERDRRTAEVEEQRQDLQNRADEQIALQLDPVMKEGQRIERDLQEENGRGIAFPDCL